MPRPVLHIGNILRWADAHREKTARWPRRDSGRVLAAPDEKWANIDTALRQGFRGLSKGLSLARLLQEHRGVRNRKNLPAYTVTGILGWTDAHRRRTGDWPRVHSGPIDEAPGETWWAVDNALRKGHRGMPGGSSLAELLKKRRRVRNRMRLPKFSIKQTLAWIDAHRQRTGMWPNADSGAIREAPEETWAAVDQALKHGSRGLAGGSSLARLLKQHRGVGRHVRHPPLSERQIVEWMDAHRQRTGRWPNHKSGPITEAPGETWGRVQTALRRGQRGLSGGLSLAKLLAEYGRARNIHNLPRLSERQIVGWARSHRKRHGRWPKRSSGAIAEAPGESWSRIDAALKNASRGLPGGSSLCQLLDDLPGR